MATYQIVTFRVGAERYGIRVTAVREVLETVRITKIPGGTPDMLGVIDVRGAVVPVLDMVRKLTGAPGAIDGESAIVVLDAVDGGAGRAVGLLVDAVLGVADQDETRVERAALGFGGSATSFLEGIGTGADGFTVLVDPERLVAGELPAGSLVTATQGLPA